MCVYVCVHVHLYVQVFIGQKSRMDAFPSFLLPYYLRQDFFHYTRNWLARLAGHPAPGIPTPVCLRHWDYRCAPLCPALLWVLRIKSKHAHLTDKCFVYRPISPVLWHLSLRTNTYSASLCQTLPNCRHTSINPESLAPSRRDLDHVFGSIRQLGLTDSAELGLCSSAHSPSQPSWGMLFPCSCSTGPSRKLLLYPHSSCQGEYLFPFSPINLCRSSALPLSS